MQYYEPLLYPTLDTVYHKSQFTPEAKNVRSKIIIYGSVLFLCYLFSLFVIFGLIRARYDHQHVNNGNYRSTSIRNSELDLG